MQAGLTQMAAWNGTLNKGYGFDWSESGSGNTKSLGGNLTAINSTSLANYSLAPDTNGSLKTYIYTIKHGAKIDNIQAAGIYQSSSNFSINLQY